MYRCVCMTCMYIHGRRWNSNPSGKCSDERPTRGTVCGTMRSMCGADAGCLAIHYQSLSNSHGARPVRQIITMTKWIRTSRFSTKNSLSHAHLRGQVLLLDAPRHRDLTCATLARLEPLKQPLGCTAAQSQTPVLRLPLHLSLRGQARWER